MDSGQDWSSEDDDGLPDVHKLFSKEEDSDTSTDDSNSDKEWRDALRAAVETEIQYQVQLRLSQDRPPSKERKRAEDVVGKVEKMRHKAACLQNSSKVETLSELSLSVQNGDPDASAADDHLRDKPDKYVTAAKQPLVMLAVKQLEKRNLGTVYDYILNKYGTPHQQLESLMRKGRFRCHRPDINGHIGIDRRIRWPTECNIVLRTPKLSKHQLAANFPLQYSSPVLGASRPHQSTHHATTVSLVYDCHQEMENLDADSGMLQFESRFESGNLRQAHKVGPFEYDLILSNDLYTGRHTQWFYFRVTGMSKDSVYHFNIINLRKNDSLYNHGMQVLMYSETEGGWRRVGYDISYRKLPSHHYSILKQNIDYFYLTWKMQFSTDNDTCYFAHCYPYSFSQLLELLDDCEKIEKQKHYIKKEVLTETLAGNPCPLITITDFEAPPEKVGSRMGVVFTARIHPGETNSSWMMHGILKYLVSEHKHAKYLRRHFVFKIVPMINPDGVIVGNYRTSLSGVDLNRVYKNPIEKVFPTIYATKRMIQSFSDKHKIALYVDLHGHSRNHNVFMYGCHTPQCDHIHFLQERVVPWLLSQLSKERFSFKSCKFAVQKCKESTGRVVIWRAGVANSFTMEASFCGTNLTKPHPLHFTQDDLMSMGQDVCELLLKLQRYIKSNSYQYKIHCRIAEYYMKQVQQEESSCRGQPLPDVVTSASAAEGEERKRSVQRMTKSLQRFHTISMKRLEHESSTSGSDSENDDFQFKYKRSKHHKNRRTKESSHRYSQFQTSRSRHTTGTSADFEQQKVEKSASSIFPTDTSLPVVVKKTTFGTEAASGTIKHSNSAPPRLQQIQHAGHGWRFVNRYANRSNRGIPMFSEERSKERAEKRLKSQSLIPTELSKLPYITSDHPLSSSSSTLPPVTAQQSPAASLHTHAYSHSTTHFPSIVWKPPEPALPLTNTSSKGSRLRRFSNFTLDSSTHYSQVQGLVEARRQLLPTHKLSRGQGVEGARVHPPKVPLPAGLPPHLQRYISDIWSRHINDL